MKVRWSDGAIADLEGIREHIAEDSETHAIALLDRLISSVESLEDFPKQGRRVPEFPDLPDLRELLVGNYRLLYRQKGQAIEIVTVVHGKRDLPGMESRPWQR